MITLDITRFRIDVEQLREEIKEELDSKVAQYSATKKQITGFDVKLFIVANDAGLLSVCTDTVKNQCGTIVPVFIQFTGQGKDHIQIPSTICGLHVYIYYL